MREVVGLDKESGNNKNFGVKVKVNFYSSIHWLEVCMRSVCSAQSIVPIYIKCSMSLYALFCYGLRLTAYFENLSFRIFKWG